MSDNHIFVTPAAGLLIVDPQLRDNLPPEGRNVEDSAYWRRREAEKSVTVAPAKAEPKAKKEGK
jgi:hypothetical protein